MLRTLMVLLFISGLAVLALPFVISSLYVDRTGIVISGHVFSKREDVVMQDSGWKRSSAVTIEYQSPDTHGAEFFSIHPEGPAYDAFHVDQQVNLRYLRRQDLPAVPFSKTLREIHALPMVRLVNERAFSRLEAVRGRPKVVFAGIVGVAMLLLIWRLARWRFLGWAITISVAMMLAWFLNQGFPRPTPAPVLDVHSGTGRVRSIGHIEQLFESTQDQGISADQPIDVIGIELIPTGRTEPVLAVDLVDTGSVHGLKENSTVSVQYEAGSPRTAYIQGATRTFVSRNLAGMARGGVIWIAVVIGLLLATLVIGWLSRGLMSSTVRRE